MGIQGLLPLLKSISTEKHISDYRGQRVGIDSYCWLHLCVYSCARDLIFSRPTTKYIDSFKKKVLTLKSFGIDPVLVFDGAPLPSKLKTETDREETREKAKAKAHEFMKLGNEREADKLYARAIDVTPQMAAAVISEMQTLGVECIVAPYEADAQLAYLSQQGYVSAVISEDSDLLLFNCAKVIYKLDPLGQCVEIAAEDLMRVKEFSGIEWSHERFVKACILSGCDYLKGLKNLGVKTAAKYFARTDDLKLVLSRVKMEMNTLVPKDYEEQFEKALLCFKHQRVYCPERMKLVHLTEPSPAASEAIERYGDDFLGPLKTDENAVMIAQGRMHPTTHENFVSGLKRLPTLDYFVTTKRRAVVLQSGTKVAVPVNTQVLERQPLPNPIRCEISTQAISGTRSKFFLPKAPSPPVSSTDEEIVEPVSTLERLEAFAYKPIYRIGLRAPNQM